LLREGGRVSDDITPTDAESAQNEWVPSSTYHSLGLIANPFVLRDPSADPFVSLETAAQSNRLLAAIDEQADQARPKVIWVEKAELPPSYGLEAVAHVEETMIRDESLNLVHAYIQLAMMRMGRVRAILQVVSERLVLRGFDKTITAWVERVLAEPDTTIGGYEALGAERLSAFGDSFAEDPLAAVHRVFGTPLIERHMELTNVVDMRPVDLESDVIDEASDGLEIESDYREARGVSDGVLEEMEQKQLDESGEEPSGEAVESAEDEAPAEDTIDDAVFEYVFEYTREHLSPVVARALRAYRVRGTIVAATELTITKAPRKTLAAVLKLARCRYRHVVVLFDNFDAWTVADKDLRSKVVGSLSEVRSLMGDDIEMVFLVEVDLAPELEEQFGHALRVSWGFENLDAYFEDPAALRPESIDSWLASAALVGAAPLSLDDPVLAGLLQAADGDLIAFARMAEAAVDDAAGRGATAFDEQAKAAGLSAIVESE
jgi:hypothetical protein